MRTTAKAHVRPVEWADRRCRELHNRARGGDATPWRRARRRVCARWIAALRAIGRARHPQLALKLPRGRAVVRARHRLARVAGAHAPDAVILAGSGYFAASLRSGGFGAPIIGTEHGFLLQLGSLGRTKRWIRTVDRLSGAKACSALVAVSRYMKDRIAETRFAPSVICIPNGIDLDRFTPDGNTEPLATSS